MPLQSTWFWLIASISLFALLACQPIVRPKELVETPTSLETRSIVTASLPSATPAVVPASPTESPATAVASALPEPNPTEIIAQVIAAAAPKVLDTYRSPDARWSVEIVLYDCVNVSGVDENAYEQIRLTHQVDGTQRVIIDQLRYCGGLGAFGLGGGFWSPNSRYFYFIESREGQPDGGNCYWDRPLSRLDVEIGQIETLRNGPLSPDKTLIAMRSEKEIILWRVDEGELARVPAAISQAVIGLVVWSPDGQSLVYLQTASECAPFRKSYLVRVDVPTRQQTVLLESEMPVFRSFTWEAPNRLKLHDEQGKAWNLNLVTKVLTETK